MVTCYVKFFPNLGANSTQIGESGNARMKVYTNKDDTLQKSLENIITGITTRLHHITKAELLEASKKLRISRLDGHQRAIFAEVSGKYTFRAMLGLSNAYLKASGLETARLAGDSTAIDDANTDANDCGCEDMARWGLPCYHWLWQCIRLNRTMPKSFVHPRWFLFSVYQVERALKWLPSWNTDKLKLMNSIPPRNIGLSYLISEFQALLERVESLTLPEQEKVADIFAQKCDEITHQIDLTAVATALPSNDFNVPKNVR
ncbi:hypothetical protein Vi05172_g2624 [Venturia inaequalis]|nr:hypothetical protein Vi05172_g2624 [Venturia inaequalis]